MALVEDILKGNLLTVAAIGATAVVLPKVLPNLSPSLRSAIQGGVSLFLEFEFGSRRRHRQHAGEERLGVRAHEPLRLRLRG